MKIQPIIDALLNRKNLIILLVGIDFLINAPLSHAQLADTIENPDWKEVPDTGIPNSPQFGNNVYIDRNGLKITGDIVIFDMVSSDGTYSRIQVNCATNSWRELRRGWFNSETRVQYHNTENDSALNAYRQKIFNAICP